MVRLFENRIVVEAPKGIGIWIWSWAFGADVYIHNIEDIIFKNLIPGRNPLDIGRYGNRVRR